MHKNATCLDKLLSEDTVEHISVSILIVKYLIKSRITLYYIEARSLKSERNKSGHICQLTYLGLQCNL